MTYFFSFKIIFKKHPCSCVFLLFTHFNCCILFHISNTLQFIHSTVDGEWIVSRFYYYKHSCTCLLIHIYNISLAMCRKYWVVDSGHVQIHNVMSNSFPKRLGQFTILPAVGSYHQHQIFSYCLFGMLIHCWINVISIFLPAFGLSYLSSLYLLVNKHF